MTSRWERGCVVTVFGASGFVGRHTVEALARDGWRVCAASRRPDALHLQPLGEVGQIYPVQTNVRYPESVQRALKRAQAVVNLVGISSPSGPQTFEAVHVGGARTIARAAREAGIRSLVHMSAIQARPDSSSHYARSKVNVEQTSVGCKDDLAQFGKIFDAPADTKVTCIVDRRFGAKGFPLLVVLLDAGLPVIDMQ